MARNLKFSVTTYGPDAFEPLQDPKNHRIDYSQGGNVDIDKVSPLLSFSAMAKDPTNGLETTYIFSWFTDVRTERGDKVHIVLPPEVRIPFAIKNSVKSLVCQGKTGLEEDGVSCSFTRVRAGTGTRICNDSGKPPEICDDSTYVPASKNCLDPSISPRCKDELPPFCPASAAATGCVGDYKDCGSCTGAGTADELVVTLDKKPLSSAGLFKVSVEKLLNPPSLRGSGPFPAIYQTT